MENTRSSPRGIPVPDDNLKPFFCVGAEDCSSWTRVQLKNGGKWMD